MMYKVIRSFTDLQDSDYAYNVGDVYPRQGMTVTAQRLAELAGANNRQGVPLIEAVNEPEAAVSAEETAEIEADVEPEETAEKISDDAEKPKRKRRKADSENETE